MVSPSGEGNAPLLIASLSCTDDVFSHFLGALTPGLLLRMTGRIPGLSTARLSCVPIPDSVCSTDISFHALKDTLRALQTKGTLLRKQRKGRTDAPGVVVGVVVTAVLLPNSHASESQSETGQDGVAQSKRRSLAPPLT